MLNYKRFVLCGLSNDELVVSRTEPSKRATNTQSWPRGMKKGPMGDLAVGKLCRNSRRGSRPHPRACQAVAIELSPVGLVTAVFFSGLRRAKATATYVTKSRTTILMTV
jgi:hypothetical protein